jgi:Zn-finger nucleic acid-binding protein
MKFCPHCGAKSDRAVKDVAALSCPDCKSGMHQVSVGATDFLECNDCGSTWIDADAFTQMCVDRQLRGAVAAMVNPARGGEVARTTRVRYLPCPVCRKTMNRQNFGRRSGVIIDVCKGHGVWFEHGELQRVMSFIDRGGLEQARAAEAERQQNEQRRLLAELSKLLN